MDVRPCVRRELLHRRRAAEPLRRGAQLVEQLLVRVPPPDRRPEGGELLGVDAGDGGEPPLLPPGKNARSRWGNRKYARASSTDGVRPRRSAEDERARFGVRRLDALALDELLEGGHAAGAELAPCLLVQLAESVLVVACGAVDASREHRVEGVRDVDDPGAEGDVLAGQVVGVAAPVEA